MTAATDFSEWLKSEDGGCCVEDKAIGDGMYVAIKPLLFHWTMIVGQIGDREGYEDRWCYANREKAETALRAWDGTGEPTGWFHHPRTARRRPEGDPGREYVAP